MRVLVTGHDGYIGTVMLPMLRASGHDVVGLDSGLFQGCVFGEDAAPVHTIYKDIRDVLVEDLRGFDALIHLAAISDDPHASLDPACSLDVNHLASIQLARSAKEAGVTRFLYASSCSVYGAAGRDAVLDENAPVRPVTPCGVSKLRVEEDLDALADADFSPTYLRNATAYGVSPRLRGDLVVNRFTGRAFTTGCVHLESDATAWRPLVHIEDVSRAFRAALEAPRDCVHRQAYNVGRTHENYRIRDVAHLVREIVIGSEITYAPELGSDTRCYRIDCTKITGNLPLYQPRWTVRAGVEELYAAFREVALKQEHLEGSRHLRVQHILKLRDSGRLDRYLRWLVPPSGGDTTR